MESAPWRHPERSEAKIIKRIGMIPTIAPARMKDGKSCAAQNFFLEMDQSLPDYEI
jgi:hypothetical protein